MNIIVTHFCNSLFKRQFYRRTNEDSGLVRVCPVTPMKVTELKG
uniref:Uncharacterized protein n=1 Tax=Anguilla anguilla TaxID=7936 RepID=A0A0E9QMS8_ANGAN